MTTKSLQKRCLVLANPLLIKHSQRVFKGQAPEQPDTQFVKFETITWGLAAAFEIIHQYLLPDPIGENQYSLCDIIDRWTNDKQFNTANYVREVSNLSDCDPFQLLDFNNKPLIVSIVKAMAFLESGLCIPRPTLNRAYDLSRR